MRELTVVKEVEMNNKIQLSSRSLFYVGLVIVLVLIISSCSTVSKQEKQTIESKKSKQWYECTSDRDGSGWDCGSDSAQKTEYSEVINNQPKISSTSNVEFQEKETIDKNTGKAEVGSLESTEISNPEAEPIFVKDKLQNIYTIQIGALAGETKRDNFVQENNLQDVALDFYESIKDGRTWWVLTYGEFSTINEANQASTELAQKYGLVNTWIRPLNDLRSEPDSTEANTKTKEKTSVSNANFYDPRYSIQLAAFKTEQKRDQFVVDKGLSNLELTYVKEGRLGQEWWIALYGEFELVKDARVKQAEIESTFGLNDTWIRPVGD